MTKKNKYPITYQEFENSIINAFLEKDWENYEEITRQQKQEFIENKNINFKEDYELECTMYDKGVLNAFDTPGDINKYIIGLLFECQTELISKQSADKLPQKQEIDESKYPMTFKEFKKKFIEVLTENSTKQYDDITKEEVLHDFNEYLKEDPTFLTFAYQSCCEYYDDCSHYIEGKVERYNNQPICPQKYAFNAEINSLAYQIKYELYF